uniref:Asparagine synthetase domain-containing protein n=1 Tax=Parascaris univalens TaxID=6257 RepID=A0A915CGT7_PARUN
MQQSFIMDKFCSHQSRLQGGTFESGLQSITPEDFTHRVALCEGADDIIRTLMSLKGGWSIVCYRRDLNEVFVGCDVFGRKSLLWSRNGGKLLIAPFAADLKLCWSNIPPATISILKVDRSGDSIWHHAVIYSAREIAGSLWSKQFIDPKFIPLSEISDRLLTISRQSLPSTPAEADLSKIAQQMIERLSDAIRRTLEDVLGHVRSLTLLFSGGVDSLLLAHLLHLSTEPSIIIDLINVSFGDKSLDFSAAPDRSRSIEAFSHLRSSFPERRFRLILVDVSGEELADCRKKYIARLVVPSFSVLDDSIACVLWFAARGEGTLHDETSECGISLTVKSESKVVLVGSGADELFGGYSRHRVCYHKGGRDAAIDEIQLELSQIGERNLSRDDRVISGLGKDIRAPFLDDLFVEWVNSIPLELKADFTKGRGFGEKVIIREALKNLGTPASLYSAPKRAMQFGTRIVKLVEGKEKGSDRCSRLLMSEDMQRSA